MGNEVWKNAYGFDGYEVSSLGNIRSKDRMIQYPTYNRRIAGRVKHCVLSEVLGKRKGKRVFYPVALLYAVRASNV